MNIQARAYPGFVCFDALPYLQVLQPTDVANTRCSWRGPCSFDDVWNAGYMTSGPGIDNLTITVGAVTETLPIAKVEVPKDIYDVHNENELRAQCMMSNRVVRVVGEIAVVNTIRVTGRNLRLVAADTGGWIVWHGKMDMSVPIFSVWAGGFASIGLNIDLATLPEPGSRNAPIGYYLSSAAIGVLIANHRIIHIGTFVMANAKPRDVLLLGNKTVGPTSLYNNFIWNEGINVFEDGNEVHNSLAEHISRGRMFILWALGPSTRYANISGQAPGDIVKGTWVMQGGGRYASCSGGIFNGPFDPRPLSGDDGAKGALPQESLQYVRVSDCTVINCPPNTRVTIGHRTYHCYFGADVRTATGECVKVTGHEIDSSKPATVAAFGTGKIGDITIRQAGLHAPAGAQAVVFCDAEARAATKLV